MVNFRNGFWIRRAHFVGHLKGGRVLEFFLVHVQIQSSGFPVIHEHTGRQDLRGSPDAEDSAKRDEHADIAAVFDIHGRSADMAERFTFAVVNALANDFVPAISRSIGMAGKRDGRKQSDSQRF